MDDYLIRKFSKEFIFFISFAISFILQQYMFVVGELNLYFKLFYSTLFIDMFNK